MKPVISTAFLLPILGNCSSFESTGPQVLESLQWPLGFDVHYGNDSWTTSPVPEACNGHGKGKFDPATWTISTQTFCPNHFSRAPYVSNGYFGQALPSESVGYWVEKLPDGGHASNGWPLDQPRATFGTIAGFWNLQEKVKYPSLPENVKRGGESVISGIPDWTGLFVTTDDGETYMPGVDHATITDYYQSMSLQDGIVHTNSTWKPRSQKEGFQLNYTLLAHRTRINLGIVRLDITIPGPSKFTITDVLDGAGATRCHFGDKETMGEWIWTSVKPWGIESTTAYVGSTVQFTGLTRYEEKKVKESRRDATDKEWVSKNASTVARSWDFDIVDLGARVISIYKYVGIASTDAFPRSALSTAHRTAMGAATTPWHKLVEEHSSAWDSTWAEADIIIPGNEELQIVARGSLFHLLTNTRPGCDGKGIGDNSIMVGGLSSDSYAGLIFWDSDVWMYPSLLLLYPKYATSINNYRSRLFTQAMSNAKSYDYSGLLFPWTSGRFGNCTGTGLCKDYQYHLNHDIAQSHWNYYLHTGDDEWLRETGWPIISNAAHMFANYVVKNESSGSYETKLLGEPDEFAYNINNGAYTNAGIKMLLGVWAQEAAGILGIEPPKNWSVIADNIKIPYDDEEGIIIEYDGMDGLVQIKQASVALINYPLGWNINERQAQNDMTFYAAATTPDGPAMTWSMFAINAAKLHENGCAAYTYLLQGYQPYIRPPFYQFSEQQTDSWHTDHFDKETNGAFPFLTGYGGFLQIFTHGFGGIIAQHDGLFMDPMMVPQLPHGLTLKGVSYRGAILDISIGPEVTTITRLSRSPSSIPTVIRIGGKASVPGKHLLSNGDVLTMETRRPDRNGTAVPGNVAQCAPAFSKDSYVPGRHPVAAVDGSNATIWQPASPRRSSIVIDLGQSRTISGIHLVWGPTPAQQLQVWGSKIPDRGYERLLDIKEVMISEPYVPEEANLVKLRPGNATWADFEKQNIQFVKLDVYGTLGNDKTVGPTVAEIVIL